MSATAPLPPGPEAWQVQSLRLIAFPTDPQYVTQQTWWRDLTGTEPENVIDRRQKHEREETGALQGATLTLGVDLLRVQWTASARPNGENIDIAMQPPVLGPFIERQRWFRDLMAGWIPRCPPTNRLAFNASLVMPVDNHRSGYQMLDRYLRWVDIDPTSSEFLYRINRKRLSETGIPQLTINRLSTWVLGKFAIIVQAVGEEPPDQNLLRGQRLACVCELDINTVPDFPGQLPHEDLPRLFAELVEAGMQIAANGDARP